MKENINVLLIGGVVLMIFCVMVLASPTSVSGYSYGYGYGDDYEKDCVENSNFFCSDIEAPELVEVSFSPSEVDTSLGDQEITMTVRVTDNYSGFGHCYINLRSVNDNSEEISFGGVDDMEIIGDNATDVIVTRTVILPQGSATGDWEMSRISLMDGFFNYVVMDGDDIEDVFGENAVVVTNGPIENEEERECIDWDGDGWGWDGEKGCKVGDDNDNSDDGDEDELVCYDHDGDGWGWDGEKGCKVTDDLEEVTMQVTAFEMSPAIIDTTNEDQIITATFTVEDHRGLDGFILGIDADGDNLDADDIRFDESIGEALIDGDKYNGTYKTTVTLEKGSIAGEWRVDWFELEDVVGNEVKITREYLEDQFGDDVATVMNVATESDTEAPQVTSFDMTPLTIDTSSKNQEVTITVTVIDQQSGVDKVEALIRAENDNEWDEQRYFEDFELISGDKFNGTYRAIEIISMGNDMGDWHVERLDVGDELRNRRYLENDDLEEQFGDGVATILNTNEDVDDELVCYDHDGDGWGWDGEKGCEVEDGNDDSDNSDDEDEDELVCYDHDGDGWGWDGEKGCKADSGSVDDENDDDDEDVLECIDWDGDGWGWDGEKGCKVD